MKKTSKPFLLFTLFFMSQHLLDGLKENSFNPVTFSFHLLNSSVQKKSVFVLVLSLQSVDRSVSNEISPSSLTLQ